MSTKKTTTEITATQLKKFRQIEQTTPPKQRRNKAREQIQKIEQELKALITKGYNREEITKMLQRADITGISKTAIKRAITEIRKQAQEQTPQKAQQTKQSPQQIKTQQQAQQEASQIKLRTERIQAQGTAPAPF